MNICYLWFFALQDSLVYVRTCVSVSVDLFFFCYLFSLKMHTHIYMFVCNRVNIYFYKCDLLSVALSFRRVLISVRLALFKNVSNWYVFRFVCYLVMLNFAFRLI